MSDAAGWIRLRGARTHNLRNVDVNLPRACLTVITGPSGSGKSSLAFDTLHAEGQRRYLETLRAGARGMFAPLPRPDIDFLDGLPPMVCVSQRLGIARPRSTLATVTEIHDHLRLLWARLGLPHCWQCGRPVPGHGRSHPPQRAHRDDSARDDGFPSLGRKLPPSSRSYLCRDSAVCAIFIDQWAWCSSFLPFFSPVCPFDCFFSSMPHFAHLPGWLEVSHPIGQVYFSAG